MIRVDHPGSGSRIRILFFLPIPDLNVKTAPDPDPQRWYEHKKDMASGSEAESSLYRIKYESDPGSGCDPDSTSRNVLFLQKSILNRL
jgi:hypothetical protein